MKPAARITDKTSHGPGLTPGPGSPNVLFGDRPAWRALPAALAGAVEDAAKAVQGLMSNPMLTPADAAPHLAKIGAGLTGAAAAAGAAGAPNAPAAASSANAALLATSSSLSSFWAAASVVPGGQPAASKAYSEGIKAAVTAAASSVFSAIGALADTHVCPIGPPVHGPGMVTRGCTSFLINDLPAARVGDKLFEACGGADPIAAGLTTLLVGD